MKGLLQLVIISLLGTAAHGRPQAVNDSQPVNPFAADCPVPSSFTISDFSFLRGTGNLPTFNITYGAGTFSCPVAPDAVTFSKGEKIISCDVDGLVQVITDGSNFVTVQEKFFCPEVPQPASGTATLQSFANNVAFPKDFFACEDIASSTNQRSQCTQAQANFTIPVEGYDIGGPIGFIPLDINGKILPQCHVFQDVNPIVANPSACNSSVSTTTSILPSASATIPPITNSTIVTSIIPSASVTIIPITNSTIVGTGTGTASAGIAARTPSGNWQLTGRWADILGRRA